jgi:thioredoxin 1
MSHLKEINAPDFDSEVIKSDKPVLVDFWAPWCGPCLMMAPVLEELSGSHADKLKIIKVNVEEQENQPLAMQYQIQSIPNMKLFKDGLVVHEFIGFKPKEALVDELEKLI